MCTGKKDGALKKESGHAFFRKEKRGQAHLQKEEKKREQQKEGGLGGTARRHRLFFWRPARVNWTDRQTNTWRATTAWQRLCPMAQLGRSLCAPRSRSFWACSSWRRRNRRTSVDPTHGSPTVWPYVRKWPPSCFSCMCLWYVISIAVRLPIERKKFIVLFFSCSAAARAAGETPRLTAPLFFFPFFPFFLFFIWVLWVRVGG